MAALSPFAFSVLSVEQAMDRDHRRSANTSEHAATHHHHHGRHSHHHHHHHHHGRQHRGSRRVTSHYNTFQTSCSPDFDEPPSYASAAHQQAALRRIDEDPTSDILPAYHCTVSMEVKVLLNLESINPLHTVSQGEWREVLVSVTGTMLNIYRCKDGVKGKILRMYTLQHAEVGLAPDVSHTVYVPSTRLAHLIPTPARSKAYKKDPRLFEAQAQHVLRLRAETDQLLFAQRSQETIHNLIHTLCAAIDISAPIDDRTIPRQCTIPRRRRRDRASPNADIMDPSFIAEQERILRVMYPSLVDDQTSRANVEVSDADQTVHQQQHQEGEQQDQDSLQHGDEDEIDVGAIREEAERPTSFLGSVSSQDRPHLYRYSSSSTTGHHPPRTSSLHNSDPANFTEAGKWMPVHTRTPAQAARYAHRCLPVLLGEAFRASDILIYSGRRVKINWRTETLEEWELRPPSYRSHHFKVTQTPPALERSSSSASTVSDQHSSDSQATSDDILPLETPLSGLELGKVVSPIDSIDKIPTQQRPREALRKTSSHDVNSISGFSGVVYCF